MIDNLHGRLQAIADAVTGTIAALHGARSLGEITSAQETALYGPLWQLSTDVIAVRKALEEARQLAPTNAQAAKAAV